MILWATGRSDESKLTITIFLNLTSSWRKRLESSNGTSSTWKEDWARQKSCQCFPNSKKPTRSWWRSMWRLLRITRLSWRTSRWNIRMWAASWRNSKNRLWSRSLRNLWSTSRTSQHVATIKMNFLVRSACLSQFLSSQISLTSFAGSAVFAILTRSIKFRKKTLYTRSDNSGWTMMRRMWRSG